jgi:hypothetical protein
MNSKETLARLEVLANQHHDATGARTMIAIIWSADDNAGDSGFKDTDEGFAGFVLDSMRDLLSDRDHADAAAWYASHGFIA